MADPRFYRFGPFRFDAAGRVLFRKGKAVPLPPKVAETLLVLVENSGRVVEKNELLKRVWQDAFIEEGSLTRSISLLRKALGSKGDEEEYVATVSKRGYRFVPAVEAETIGPTQQTAGKIMLAVLPFHNLSGDPAQEYFSEGFTEEMITQLGRLNPDRLGVIARTSALMYKAAGKSVKQIGSELGVSYILEGSVRRAAGRVRITVQLIKVSDQTHLWAENYDRDFGDILQLQNNVAQVVARQIEIKLTPRSVPRSASVDPETYQLCLKGRYFWYKRTEEALKKGIEYFNQALARDATYAPAYDGISDSYVLLACRGVMSAEDAFGKAKAAAKKALEIDDMFADAHASLAHIRLHEWDWEGLDEEFRRAIALNPARAIAYPWYSEYLMVTGRPEEAIALARQAQRLDPLSPVINSFVSSCYYFARHYESAKQELLNSVEIEPAHFLPHLRLGQIYIVMGSHEEAVAEMTQAVALSGRSMETLAGLGQAYAAAGKKTNMNEVLRELEAQSRARYVSPYNMAKIHACFPDLRQTLTWLERAYEERNPDLIEIGVEPVFDKIRSGPEFERLCKRFRNRGGVERGNRRLFEPTRTWRGIQ
jgi:TolB-like protein/Tfp pilus assembly protein PilF